MGKETQRGARSRTNWSHWPALRRVLLPLAGVLGLAAGAAAQSLTPGGPVDFGQIQIGKTSSEITLTFSVPPSNSVTVTAVTATTEGVVGKDYAVSNSTCIGTLLGPTTCDIKVTFTPSALGLRLGELFVTDGTTNVISPVPLRGAGLGPQLVLSPSTGAVVPVSGLTPAAISPSAALYDGNGNLFVEDIANGRLVEEAAGASDFTNFASVPGSSFSSMALGGDGTIYVSSPGTGVISAVSPAGVVSTLPTPGVTLVKPEGLAIDGFGYLYVADAGANQIVRVALDGSGAAALTLSGLSTPLAAPSGLTVDYGDILFVADAGNNRIVRIDLHTSAAILVATPGETLSSPSGITVNAAGGLTVADTGNSRLVEVPLIGASYAISTTGATLTTPEGVLLLGNGDLLVSDTTAGLVKITRSTTSYTFPTKTLVNTLDTADGDFALTVENTGSYDITLSSSPDPSYSTGAFATDSTGTCPASGGEIAGGSTCTEEISFTPTIVGLNTATMTLTGTASTGQTATVTATLNGTGYTELSYFQLTVSPSIVTPGEPTTLTVVAINTDGSIDTTYTGTITLTSTDPAATFPNNSITYTFTTADNGTHVFSSALANPLTFNTLGTWTVTATDHSYTGTSNPVQVVSQPTVGLTSSANPTLVGNQITLTATVTSPAGTPTGTVTFFDGTTVLGTATLNGTTASLPVSFTTTGTHVLTAAYSGGGPFQAATSAPLNEVVQSLSSALTLTSSANPALLGGSVVLTASLTVSGGTPTGTVTFFDGSTKLGTVSLNGTGATLAVSFTSTGTHTLTAVYSGGGVYQGATSAPLNELIEDFTLTLATGSPTSVSILLGQSATYNVVVTPVGGATLAAEVNLSVAGLPAGSTAVFTPANAAAGQDTTPVQLVVNAPPLTSTARRETNSSPWRHGAPAVLALLLLPVGSLLFRRKRMAKLLLILVGVLAATSGLSGCLSNTSTGYYGQQSATYPLTVSGTSGTLVHSVQVSLTIQ